MKKKTASNKLPPWLEYPSKKLAYKLQESPAGEAEKVVLVAAPPAQNGKKPPAILKDYPKFKAAAKEWLATGQVAYLGMGELAKLDVEALGELFQTLGKKTAEKYEHLIVEFPAGLWQQANFTQKTVLSLLATALGTAVYPTDLLKAKPAANKIILQKVTVILNTKPDIQAQKILEERAQLAVHMNAMRQTQALPGNYLTAETMEQRARDIARRYKLKITVLGKAELEKMGAGGILAVNQGSAKEPRLIVLDYHPRGAQQTLALVGKGVTFDTGGISLKPSSDLHEMKYDMSGSAAVLHAVAAIAELALPVRVVGAVGMVENMPSGTALKPGDVYKSLKGLTIEVQNTDAEGRLVLGDLLYYTEKNYSPDLMVDLATLTGACVVALGHYYAGLFTPKDSARWVVEEAARESLEPVWPLPVGRLYKEMLKSDIADHNNIGGRWGGASSAAAFLSLFVDEKTEWAHLDIAGVGMLKKGFGIYPAPASGYGIHLLVELARHLGLHRKG